MDGMEVTNYGGELSLSRPAETVFKEAEMVAGPWGKKVEQLTLFKNIQGNKHLFVEAWQMLAACYRVTTRVVSTNYLDYGEVKGFECRAEAIFMPTGQVIGVADAMCLNDEDKWGPRPKYDRNPQGGRGELLGYVNTPLQQLRSMAQTRAQSKVLASLFKWVARLKGYQGTPAEEMTGHEYDGAQGSAAPASEPQRRSTQAAPAQPAAAAAPATAQAAPAQPAPADNGEKKISEAQGKRLYAKAMNAGYNHETLSLFLSTRGFSNSRDIPMSQYDGIIAEIETGEQHG